jgi:hypothetical protein
LERPPGDVSRPGSIPGYWIADYTLFYANENLYYLGINSNSFPAASMKIFFDTLQHSQGFL